jgi:hypothetical protein
VVEYLPSMCKALGSIPSPQKQNKNLPLGVGGVAQFRMHA